MRDDRVLRVLRPALALVALAALLVVLGLALTGPVNAATKSPEPKATKTTKAERTKTPTPAATSSGPVVVLRGAEVRFGDDILVPKGTRVPSVVAFGGDITVNGAVTESVVAFGGYVVINGRVGSSVVAFGGDVKLGPNAVVGRKLGPSDSAIVLFGGRLDRAPGAQVMGPIERFERVDWNGAGAWAARAWLQNSFLGFSLIGWLIQTAFFLVLALVAAALMPKQLKALQAQLARRPLASLGWGALAFFIALPAVLIVLVISVIGLLLVLPYGVFVLLAYFFVTTGVAAFVAQRIINGFGGKENLMLAVALGVVGTTVVSRIPFVGPLLLIAMMVLGIGAAILGVAEWRRRRREEAVARTAAAAAAAPYPAPAGGVTAPAAVITPIVQTSPAQQQAAQAGVVPSVPPQPPVTPEAPPTPQAPATPPAPVTPDTPAAPAGPAAQPPAGEVASAQEPATDAPQTEPEGGERPGQST